MRVKMTFAVLAITALALSLPASSTANRTVTVEAGESIQAAIDAAKPGTTIKLAQGIYRESISISKSDIEIVGEGRKKTEIAVPAAADLPEGAGCVDEFDGQKFVSGICVFPEAEGQCENSPRVTGPDAPPVVRAVDDVEISKLAVTGFTSSGVIYFCADDPEVTRVYAKAGEADAEYGVAAFASEDVVFSRNLTVVGGEAGIYIGDSPHADAVVWKNVAWNSSLGFFIRDSQHGTLKENKAFGNCVGIVFLNTDESQAPPQFQGPSIDVKDWLAKENNATANNRTCPAFEGEDPLSGIGIGVVSAIDVSLIDNDVYGNDSTAPSIVKGGIVVMGEPGFKPSTGTKVGFNTAFGNTPDLFWDGAGDGNKFFANDCLTSQPDGLCEDPGNTNHHGDDDDHQGGDRDHGDKHDKKSKKHKGGKHSKHKNKKRYKHHDD